MQSLRPVALPQRQVAVSSLGEGASSLSPKMKRKELNLYRKKTLRNLPPTTRRYARTINSLQGILKRLQNLTQDIARLELDSTALHNRHKHEQATERETSLDHHLGIDQATEILFGEEEAHEL